MIRPEQMPYTQRRWARPTTAASSSRSSTRGCALADWNGFAARREASKRRGKLRGRGIATFLEWTGGNAFEEKVSVDVTADGVIEIFSATQAMGQGIATSYAQLAVDVFGVPIEKIRIVQGDTDRGNGFGSAGSRSLFTGGSAVRVASERTVEHAQDARRPTRSRRRPRDIEYRDGALPRRRHRPSASTCSSSPASRPEAAHPSSSSTTASAAPSWPNGCHVCEVEIDPETGDVEIAAYASVNDIGRVVNPMIVRGQVDGGAVQGIGQALVRAGGLRPREPASCSPAASWTTRCRAPTSARRSRPSSTPRSRAATNPLGVKGVGELGTIGATPAAMNAVVDALDHAGLGRAAERIGMPATSERIWQLLRGLESS